MAIPAFLAMTAAEIRGSFLLPPKIGWMACHFSPYSVGLSNLPRSLPPGSLLILNDITPIHGHDPEVVADQVRDCVTAFGCSGVLLDFQRKAVEETAAMAAHLTEVLPCPVALSEVYAAPLACPVFLSPLPHHIPLEDWLAPWKGREVWLEIGMDAEEILLTESGAAIRPLPHFKAESGFQDEALHCHYRIDRQEDSVQFTLWRTREDVDALLEEAEVLGITTSVGLYQQFR